MADENLNKIFRYLDEHQQTWVDRLAHAVSIQSVSAWPEKRGEIKKQVEEVRDMLVGLGASCELVEPGKHTTPDGQELDIPPIIFAHLGSDKSKKTILIYGHLDVQPAAKSDGWDTEPFVLQEIDGKLYGRGSTDDKGPCLAWINCIETHQKLGIELPVNLKFIFEGMEESGSEGLEETIAKMKETTEFFKSVDYVCISDNYWLGKKKPCITYGLRGICPFQVEIQCSSKDLHSGLYGGSVHEAMSDLIYIMDNLVDKDGKIIIPGLYDDVAPLTPEEAKLYESIEFDVEDFRKDVGANKLMHPSKEKVLQHRWRFPSLSLHGIEGAFYETGFKTVIPSKVIGKFSIRIVPDMTPERVAELVKKHVANLWAVRGSPNDMQCVSITGGRHWVSPFDHPHYEAAKKAVYTVHGMEPDMTREGGSIPVTLTLQEATGKNTILLPFGLSDDGAHSQNEKFDLKNYMNGMKLAAAYFKEVSRLE
ncbi:cytosolic non-specific dipeptidase-like [Watersipora subatra]|uniref:cytosolic non-specific dipeptidase-like n=1 Tax=Watersipora subatra TaxID=2589382 RepID=UPI00355B5744